MAATKPRRIFRSVDILETARDGQKTAENLVFLQFSLTRRRRSRMMRMSVAAKPTERKLCMGKFGNFKGDMAKLTQSQFMKELAAATDVPNKTNSGLAYRPGGQRDQEERRLRGARNRSARSPGS
jgi:hypothetical protein